MSLRHEIAVKTAEQEDHFEYIKEDFEESKKFLVDLELNCENTKKELAEYRNMTRDMTLVSDGLVSGGDVDQWFHEFVKIVLFLWTASA